MLTLKEPGNASPRMARIVMQVTVVFTATVPIFAFSTSLYRRQPIVPLYLLVGYSAGFILAVFGLLTIRWVTQGEWDRFKPGYIWMNMVLLAVVVTVTNLAADDPTGVHTVMFLMPMLMVAVMGSLPMMASVYSLCMAGLVLVVWQASDRAIDTTVWTAIVHGAVWVAACAAVHIGVVRFLGAMRSAESMSSLAGAAAVASGWPNDLQYCAEHVAGALETNAVTVFSASPLLPPTPVAQWPAGIGVPANRLPPAHETTGTGTGSVIVTRDGLVIPVVTATDLVITICTNPSRLPDDEVEGIALTVGRLVGGIAERSALQAGLRLEARQDLLTGLPNRRSLMEAFEREFIRMTESGDPLLVVMLDIDHFKRFNDSFGHVEGDRLLRHLGESLAGIVRPFDTAARYGGEEFCLLLPATRVDGAAALLGRLKDLLAEAGPGDTAVTFSAGIAVWDGDESPEALIKRADEALYAAKEGGRDRVCAAKGSQTDDQPTDMANSLDGPSS